MKRFESVYSQGTLNNTIKIIIDTFTGVLYLNVTEGYGGGICALLNADGTPRLYSSIQQKGNTMKKFETIYSRGTFNQQKIIRDTDTGVAYVFMTEGYGGGLCALLNPDGTPMVYMDDTKKDDK